MIDFKKGLIKTFQKPGISSSQYILHNNRSGKIRLTGKYIDNRPFPVRQPKLQIGRFLSHKLYLLLDGGWTTKSPAVENKSILLPKSICLQEVVSSCIGKDLSAWRRSPISSTDYSGRDHITVKDCFWIARLIMKHSFSVSELQMVCSVHVANYPFQVVSVHYVRKSGVVVSVEELYYQLPKHWTLCQKIRDSVILRLTE